MESIILSLIAIIVAFLGPLLTSLPDVVEPKIYTYVPCSPPIRYQLGTIDEKFKLQEKTLLERLGEAEKIWEGPYGQDVFIYDPEGTKSASKRLVTINMVYDERQKLSSQIKQLEGRVGTENKKVQTNIAQYETRVRALNQRSEELSEKMKNLSIGDPEYSQKFDEIFKESQGINQEAQSLNEIAATINQSTQSYNREVGRLNNIVSKFNETMTEKPEEGIYKPDGDIIEIYLTNSNSELIHTLAHELGHAIGINHISNPKAIMYPSTSQTTKLTGEDLAAIQEACKEQVSTMKK